MNSSIGVVESRDEERRRLREMNNRDDLFDVFIKMVSSNAPLIYVFLNVTLIIWVAQTIFSSNLSSVPSSIYLIAPLLTTGPLYDIVPVSASQACPANTTVIHLQSIPTIVTPTVSHKELNLWGDPGFQFCVRRLPLSQQVLKSCAPGEILCSGYCVNLTLECPITDIRAIPDTSPTPANYTLFMTSGNQSYYYSRR
jgi:hypothetical protein